MTDELEKLTSEAAEVDAETLSTPATLEQEQEETAQPAHDEVAELSGLLTIVSSMFAPVFPSLTKIYTPETISSIATAAVPVMTKRGWSVSVLLGQYAEEVALLVVAAPVALATYQGIKSDIAAKNKEAQAPQAPHALEAGEGAASINPASVNAPVEARA